MKNIRLFIKALLIFVILFSSSYPQLKFDLNTFLEEKIQLRFIKISVINNLKNSNWARIVEFGEDYSLWLTNLERYVTGDSIKYEFYIELRTPTMINRGKLSQIRHITVTYDTSGTYQVNENDDSLIENLLVQSLQNTKIYTSLHPVCLL